MLWIKCLYILGCDVYIYRISMVTFNKNFTHDLQFGELSEKKVAEILQNEKIEVKTERDIWATTGNLFVEIESRGKPSGLATTQAVYWMPVYYYHDRFCFFQMFEVDVFKKIVKRMFKDKISRKVWGGDDNTSRGILVPINKIPEYMVKIIGEIDD